MMIFFNLLSGMTMAYFEKIALSVHLLDIHKQCGAIILALVTLRLFWRFTHKYPSLNTLLPQNERLLARFGHILLYLLMFAVPISGILFSQSFGKDVYLIYFKLPHLIDKQSVLTAFQLLAVHKYLAIIILTMIIGHIIAALKHHFIDKNMVLVRMLPKRR